MHCILSSYITQFSMWVENFQWRRPYKQNNCRLFQYETKNVCVGIADKSMESNDDHYIAG